MISASNPHDRFFRETFGRLQVTRGFLRSHLLYHGEESWRWGERLSGLHTGPEPPLRYWSERQDRLPAIFELLRGLTEQREALVYVGGSNPMVVILSFQFPVGHNVGKKHRSCHAEFPMPRVA